MAINVTLSDNICRLLFRCFFFLTNIINSNLRAAQQLHICSIAIQSAHTGFIFYRRNMQRLHHQGRLRCMTCLTRLINDLSKAHTTSLGKCCGPREMQAERRNERESELNLRAERWSSRWCQWQVWSPLGITLHLWYSDCIMSDISALISATHHTIRKVPSTWMAFKMKSRLPVFVLKLIYDLKHKNVKNISLLNHKGLQVWCYKVI